MTDTYLMRLDKIEFRNYRSFKALDVHFHDRLTVMVAPNGGGKTAVLDGIAMSLQMLVDGLMGKIRSQGFEQSDAHRTLDSQGFMQPHYPVSISGTMRVPLIADAVTWSCALYGKTGRRTTYAESALVRKWAKIVGEHVSENNGSPMSLPLIAYYGTGRLWGELRLTKKRKTIDTAPNAHERGYQDCLDPSSHYGMFRDWFKRFSYQSKHERDAVNQDVPRHNAQHFLDVVVNATDLALAPSGWGKLAWDFAEDTITAQHLQHGRLPVDALSDGIRTIIGLVADIAHRTARLNPHLGKQANTSPGVVLIDEIDMHLHPEWQQQILDGLRFAFPEVQFIITTHSPQVITSVPNDCIRIIDVRDGVAAAKTPELQTRGVESADALARVMGVDPIPKVQEAAWLSEYRSMIEQGQHEVEAAHRLQEKLNAHFGPRHPVMLDCERLVRFQRIKQRPTGPAPSV